VGRAHQRHYKQQGRPSSPCELSLYRPPYLCTVEAGHLFGHAPVELDEREQLAANNEVHDNVHLLNILGASKNQHATTPARIHGGVGYHIRSTRGRSYLEGREKLDDQGVVDHL
jgi:hypothetical protein